MRSVTWPVIARGTSPLAAPRHTSRGPWPRPLSDYPARPCVTSSQDHDGPLVQYGREIAVAKNCPAVENMS